MFICCCYCLGFEKDDVQLRINYFKLGIYGAFGSSTPSTFWARLRSGLHKARDLRPEYTSGVCRKYRYHYFITETLLGAALWILDFSQMLNVKCQMKNVK